MVIGRIASLVGPTVRGFVRVQSRNIYQVLKIQDRIIDKTYRKAGLYNRGIVTGIKHGLIAGQVIGGTLNLGLAPDSPGRDLDGPIQKKPRYSSRKSYKTRGRFSRCYPTKRSSRQKPVRYRN